MSHIDEDLKYTKNHEWVRMEDEFTAVCGLTDHAQEMLTTIVFVDLPEIGTEAKKDEQIAVVESAKAISDILAPLTGTLLEVNEELEDRPELINKDPYEEGWILKIDISAPSEIDDLLSPEEYQSHLDSGE